MASRYQQGFAPVGSSECSFNVTIAGASTANALESTGTREWSGATGRAIRLAETGGIDCYIKIGTSDAVAASTDSLLFLGNTVEVFPLYRPGFTHLAAYSSTSATLNVTIGYGQ